MEWGPQQQGESAKLVHVMIESELQQVGISLQRSEVDTDFKNYLVTTDKKVPDEVISKICQYAAYKGMAVKFRTSEREKEGRLPMKDVDNS